MTFASCRLHQATLDSSASSGDDGRHNPFQANLSNQAVSAPKQQYLKIQKIVDGKPYTLAELIPPSCTPERLLHPKTTLRLQILSHFGQYESLINLKKSSFGESAEVGIEESHLTFPLEDGSRAQILTPVCDALAHHAKAEAVTATSQAELLIRHIVEQIAPDCADWSLEAQGFRCQLPKGNPELAGKELTGIQSAMIRRWSRQPYLLARRLALGLSLAQALQSKDVDAKLDTLCKIIQHSLTLELPATLASKRWQDSVCGPTHPYRQEAALFGLAKTVAEIDFMRQLFERTSRLGSLTVKVPTPTHTRLIMVSLTPEADVAEKLARETARLWTEAPNAQLEELPRSCWHPVYGQDADLMNLARHLALSGDTPDVVCLRKQPQSQDTGFSLERYFADSITSETEFIIPNGRSITLRMPIGHYTYTLSGLPENTDEWDDIVTTGPHSNGSIVWDSQRPKAQITQW